MSEVTTLPAPDLGLKETTHFAWENEQRAFLRLLPTLLATHQGQYLAVYDGRVIAEGLIRSKRRSGPMHWPVTCRSMSGWSQINRRDLSEYPRRGCPAAGRCDGSVCL
jgi:hypothetical protein